MQSDPQHSPGRAAPPRRVLDAGTQLWGRFQLNLPGQLLAMIIGLVVTALVLVYFPAAAAYRLQWMQDRAEAAHLAALAADVAEDSGALGERTVEELLDGVGAVAVSRVRDGINELILYGGPINAEMVISDLREASWWDHIRETIDTLYAEDGRMLRIRAEPDARPTEVIDVILAEEPLKEALSAFSRQLLTGSVVIALGVGLVIYLAMFFLFVRPMRRLAGAMVRFRAAPEDASRVIAPSTGHNEIARAERELAAMQAEIRQALHQRERLAALGEAVAKINHDLRNVLTSAQLVTDRLAMEEDERIQKMASRLVRSVGRGIRLCEATLEFGRADEAPSARTRVVMAELIEDALDNARLADGDVDWHLDIDRTLSLDVDQDQAHRIFFNLFRNAIQAMNVMEGEKRLSVTVEEDGHCAHFWVRDSGPGLPTRARDNLFKAFTGSTRKGGSGLGLAIARELARAHGGDLVLIKSDESGTVFAVMLPLATD